MIIKINDEQFVPLNEFSWSNLNACTVSWPYNKLVGFLIVSSRFETVAGVLLHHPGQECFYLDLLFTKECKLLPAKGKGNIIKCCWSVNVRSHPHLVVIVFAASCHRNPR